MTPNARIAQRIAIIVPAVLLAGAYLSQYGFGLYPCEICRWQRWPHFAALSFATLSTFSPPRRMWIVLAAFAILTSGLIGVFHAGVEYDWWEGITGCATLAGTGGDPLAAVLNAPIVRCDQAAWRFLGLSLAGWNALISILAVGTIIAFLARFGNTAAIARGQRPWDSAND